MKLSESIRLGAMLRPQAFGALYRTFPRGPFGLWAERKTSCALGAAYEASGIAGVEGTYQVDTPMVTFRGQPTTAKAGSTYISYESPWYAFTQIVQVCPQCGKDSLELCRLISHLNDDHRWTREAIADFVEQIEQKIERQKQPALVQAGAAT